MKRYSKLPSKLKGLFFVLKFDRIVPTNKLLFLSYIASLSKWIRKNPPVYHNDFYNRNFVYNNRTKLFENIIAQLRLDTKAVDYLEFGVSTGDSFRWWINHLHHENTKFYGFDTFTGLPENWGPFKKGDMGNNNEIPKIE